MSLNIVSESIISSIKIRIGLVAVITLVLLACGAKPKNEAVYRVIIEDIPQPYNLTADASNGKATIYWNIDRQTDLPISGYRIYLGDKSYVEDTAAWRKGPGVAYNSELYPGDTDGDNRSESFNFNNLENGRVYYAMVRTVGADKRESVSSNVVSFRPLAKGEFTLSSNHLANDGGFNLETESQVPAIDPRSDLYLYSTENKMGLSSPSRLRGGLRRSEFSLGNSEKLETVTIKTGDRISLYTTRGTADLTVLSISGKYPETTAKIGYIFYPANR